MNIEKKRKELYEKKLAKQNIVIEFNRDKVIKDEIIDFVIEKNNVREKSRYFVIFKIYKKDKLEVTFRRDLYQTTNFTQDDYKREILKKLN